MIHDDLSFVGGEQRGGVLDDPSWREDGRWAWVTLVEPDEAELAAVHRATGLDLDALEQVRRATVRPTLVIAGDTAVLGYRLSRYRWDEHSIELLDFVIVVGPDNAVVVGDAATLRDLTAGLAATDLRRRGPAEIFVVSAELVIDSYLDVIEGLDVDIRKVERQVFSSGRDNPVEQIYRLRRGVADLEEHVARMNEESSARFVHRRLPAWMSESEGWFEENGELAEFDRQLDRMVGRIRSMRTLLDSMLDANLVQVGIQQNVDMRKISAWVAVAAIPAMFGGIWGMNFEHMPELSWRFGYPLALAAMASACSLLLWRFRKNGWL